MLLWAEQGPRTFAYDNRQTNSNDAVRDHSPLYPSQLQKGVALEIEHTVMTTDMEKILKMNCERSRIE